MPRISHKRAPTMNDVAERAGVSQTTVSFVLNDVPNANIPQETRDRIAAAVEELGYRRNVLARNLRSGRSGHIGFITDLIATTPYAGRIIEGAQDVAWDHDYMLLLVDTQGREDIKRRAIELMLESQVEGIIYATMWHRPVNVLDAMREAPVVLLNCYDEQRSLPSVVPDEVQGGRTATELLLHKGHRRIAFVNAHDQVPAAVGRLEGYKQSLAAHSILFDPQFVLAANSSASGGYDAVIELMGLPNPPTALFCYNDRMAMGAYDALRKLGRRIPEDVAVVGFDNQEIIAANLHPGLTTLQLPHYEMGAWAVDHLLHLLTGDEAPPAVQHKIKCPLVERDST